MRKIIALGAFIVGAIDFFAFLYILVTGSAFTDMGFAPHTIICLVVWFACVFTFLFCVISKFLFPSSSKGKTIQKLTKNCPYCSNGIPAESAFCPHCGGKL